MNYDKLYELAFEFKKTKLWKKVSDSEIFAVKLSNNRIGYITITGMANQVFMLAMYVGEEAVQGLLRMLFDTIFLFSQFEQREFMLTQNCLQCSFEDKDFIGDDEAELVKKYAKKHKIKLSKDNAYPFFWKYAPYRVPDKIKSENDAEYLCEALSAALELAKRLNDNDNKEKLGLKHVNKRTRRIIMLEKTDEGYKIGKTDFPKRTFPKYPVPKCENELAFTRLKTFENKIELECEIVRSTEPAVEDENSDDAGFPVILFAVNANSYFILPVEPVLFYEDNPDKLMDTFINALIKLEICPTAIKALNRQTFDFFEPFCEKLGITIKQIFEPSEVMEYFQNEYESLENSDDNDDSELTEEQEEQFNEMLNGLLGFSQGRLSKNEFIDMLGSLGVELPEKLTETLDDAEKNISKVSSNKVISLDGKRNNSKDSGSDKAYVISVSLYKGCYRHIKMSGDSTLLDLHFAIINAFDFNDDHLHVFFMDNKMWSTLNVYYDERASEPGTTTSEVTLEEIGLSVGKQFKYLFDFGDEWLFQCKVLKIFSEPNVRNMIIKSVGESPEQYPEYEDDWEEEDEDFDPEIFPL